MKKILFSLLMLFMFSITVNAASISLSVNSSSVNLGDTITVTATVDGDDADAWSYCLSYNGPVSPQGSSCVTAGSVTNGRSSVFTFNTTASGTVSFGIASAEVLNYKAEEASVTKGSASVTVTATLIPVYRMYNPVNGEHLYTTDAHEVDVIYSEQGWGFEGIGWYTTNVGTPVYRLYNPKLGNHLYTTDLHEIEVITTTQGWVKDFNGAPVMYSSGSKNIYRLFNPGLNGQHHLTNDFNEYNVIPAWGWQQEGIAMQAEAEGIPITTYYYKDSNIPIDFNNITNNNISIARKYASVVNRAKSYISHLAFSYQGLVEQLEYEKFTHEEAVYGASHAGADWNAEAVESAKSYISHLAFSYQGLVEQLEYEKFTHEQAVYGANNSGADWNAEAVESAKSYIRSLAFSYQGLVEQLEYEKFTHEQAVYGASHADADWNAEAVESAKSYMKYFNYSKTRLIEQLEYEKFTHEQAVYGANNCGYF